MNFRKGQVLALILLVMSTILVIGLTVASRSVTSLKISNQTERSQRAFSAAEAGIEEALRVGGVNAGNIPTLIVNGINVTVTSDPIKQLKLNAFKDKSYQIDPKSSNNLTISWYQSTDSSDADLEISVLKQNSLDRYYCDTTAGGNNVGSAINGCPYIGGSGGYSHSFTLKGSQFSGAKAVRITPRFSGVSLLVSGDSLPDQGYTITSSAQTEEGLVRKVQVVTTNPALPEVFDYSVFSGGDL